MLDHRTHTFLEVYRHRSFTRAAESLLITQPAASQHVKQLEAHYGCPLFVKTGRGIEPTPAAEMLYRRLLAMENDERRIRLEAVELSTPQTSRRTDPLRFGCTRTIADHVAPRIVSEYLRANPETPVTMLSGNTSSLMDELEHGTIDFALVEGFCDRARFSSTALSRERYIAVAKPRTLPSPGSPDDRRPEIRHLLGQRLIVRESGSGTREILEKHLAARDLSISDFAGFIELESIPTIKACVRAGAGISFLYQVAVEREIARGELEDVTPRDFEIEHDFCLIWQRGSQYGPRYRALAKAWRALMNAKAPDGVRASGLDAPPPDAPRLNLTRR